MVEGLRCESRNFSIQSLPRAGIVRINFCQTCLKYSNRFADKAEKLLGATSNMAGVAGVSGQHEAFEAARLAVQQLRNECETLKADMKRHKSEHGDA
jgi:hypothetical protein